METLEEFKMVGQLKVFEINRIQKLKALWFGCFNNNVMDLKCEAGLVHLNL